VALLIAVSLLVPVSWVVGLALMAITRPRGWRLTLAISPVGLAVPMYLYGQGVRSDLSRWVSFPLAATLLIGCLAATHRLMTLR
jgi:hypothetical protein